jgi:hypothetical protein
VRAKIQRRGKREAASRPAVRSQLLLPVPVWSWANQQEEEEAKGNMFEFSRAQQGKSSRYVFSRNPLSDMQSFKLLRI